MDIHPGISVEGAGAPKPTIKFETRDWLALLAGFALALLWRRVFGFENIIALWRLPSFGAVTFTAAIWAAVLLYLGKDAKWNRLTIGLSVGVGLLCLASVTYSDMSVTLINYLLILCGSALAFFSLSGSSRYALNNVRVVLSTVGLTFMALFSNWLKPFRALDSYRKSDDRKIPGVLVGVLVSLPVLAVVIWLLSSADAVFNGIIIAFENRLGELRFGSEFSKAIRVFLYTLAFFSAIYFLRHPPEISATAAEERKTVPMSTLATALSLLGSVYVVFVAIQFRYLFGGAEAAIMDGGFAYYARNGFFELVFVAAINLAVVLLVTVIAEPHRLLRVLSTLLLALTAVILFSAFWRMRLYIHAYDMSLLRAMTLWAMAFIAVCLALAALKVWKTGFKFWPFFAAIGLYGWIIFNFVNIDARIADYNVDAYLSGQSESIDAFYLLSLSPDVLPALEQLEATNPNAIISHDSSYRLGMLLEQYREPPRESLDWTEWNLSYLRHK